MITLYEAVEQFLNLIIPITRNFGWWSNFREISIIVLTYLVVYLAFILPFIRLLKWGIFGSKKTHKELIKWI
jgi:hypothetical protein